VSPWFYRGPGGGAGFEDDRFEFAFEQVRRGGESYRACADHGDGKVLHWIHAVLCSSSLGR
jgi:hypothetical protein